MTTHDLKTWPEPFAAILDGRKTYEIRKADRPFAVGDRLRLREYLDRPAPFTCRSCGTVMSHLPEFVEPRHAGCGGEVTSKPLGFTGREVLVEVTYKTAGGDFGLPMNMCVMAIRKVAPSLSIDLTRLAQLAEQASSEPDSDEPTTCLGCRTIVTVHQDLEPSALCNLCAQEYSAEMGRAIPSLIALAVGPEAIGASFSLNAATAGERSLGRREPGGD